MRACRDEARNRVKRLVPSLISSVQSRMSLALGAPVWPSVVMVPVTLPAPRVREMS
jgi:hypothetical protein